MRGKRWTIGFYLAVCAALIIGSAPGASAESLTLTYSNFFPPTHIQSKLAEAWCKEVEKATQGRVKVQYFPGQTLTKATQIFDGVEQGLSDIGFCLFGYTRGRFPLMEVVDLPMGYKSGTIATQVVNNVYEQFKPKELAGVEVMYLHAHGPGLLNTRKKGVKTMADLKGLKIRSHGTTAKVVKALGGTPVAMPMPEVYQSLQKGVVDGAMYPMEANKGWKLGEVIDNVTMCTSMAYTTSFYVVMNKDKWAKIAKKDQDAIKDINDRWIPKHGKAWDDSDRAGLEFVKSKGVKIIELDPGEAAKWKKLMGPVLDEYAAAAEKKGVPGKKAVAFTLQAIKDLSQ